MDADGCGVRHHAGAGAGTANRKEGGAGDRQRQLQLVPPLKTAAGDARAVQAVLQQRYGFETTLLLNATRAQIVSALNVYRALRQRSWQERRGGKVGGQFIASSQGLFVFHCR